MFTKLKHTTKNALTGRRRWIVAGGVAVLVLGGAATATAAVADRYDDRGRHGYGRDGGDGDIGEDGTVPTATAVALAQAVETAVAEAGGGIVYEVDLDGTKEHPVWDVELYGNDGKWHEVRVDATSGEVTRHETEASGDGHGEDGNDDD